MPRKGPVRKRRYQGDQKYNNLLIARLINRSMIDGKKSVAQKEIYAALDLIVERTNEDALVVFERALNNIRPEMEVRARRVGGAAYQVPSQVRGERKDSLALRWLVNAARSRSNTEFHTYAEKMAQELIDASKNEGGAVKKRQEMERIAEANKAFSHFRW